MKTNLYLGLGSNIAPRRAHLYRALEFLYEVLGVLPVVSSLYESPPWRGMGSASYLNMVAACRYGGGAEGLMERLLDIERRMGRRRGIGIDRPIDIDILDYGGRILRRPGLTLPHPRLAQRAFVLVPLREVAPDWRHPADGRSVDELIAALPPSERGAIRRVGAFYFEAAPV